MPVPEVEAVDIPEELAPDTSPEEAAKEAAKEVAENADIEEKVDEKDSTVKKMEGVSPSDKPLTAKALRAKSEPEKQPGKVGSSIMTRTEARTFTFRFLLHGVRFSTGMGIHSPRAKSLTTPRSLSPFLAPM